nr:hypothetical protein [Bacillus pumilus]
MKRKLMMAGMAAFIGTTWLYIPGNENRAFAYEDLDQKTSTNRRENIKD